MKTPLASLFVRGPNVTPLEARLQFQALTRIFCEEIEGRIARKLKPPASKYITTDYPYHFCFDFNFNDESLKGKSDQWIRREFIIPAVRSAVKELRAHDVQRFAYLPMPREFRTEDSSWAKGKRGAFIRGLRTFDVGISGNPKAPCWVIRFDVLFQGNNILGGP